MTSELINKINQHSKLSKFNASKDYRSNSKSCVPYKEYIVTNEKYPNKYFLIHENMIFDRNSICDSSYDIWSFDENGDLIKKEDTQELGFEFFWNKKHIIDL